MEALLLTNKDVSHVHFIPQYQTPYTFLLYEKENHMLNASHSDDSTNYTKA